MYGCMNIKKEGKNMLNQVVIVGRLVGDVELKETESGKKKADITLAVSRSFKNFQGEYETDFIRCQLFNNVAENTAEYCKKGDLIGIRGMLQSYKYEDKNYLKVVAEKVTFLSSKTE